MEATVILSAIFIFALVSGLGVPVIIFAAFRLSTRWGEQGSWKLMFWLLSIAFLLSDLRAPRTENAGNLVEAVWRAPISVQTAILWSNRILIYTVLGLCLVMVVRGLLLRPTRARAATPLWVGFFLLSLGPLISSVFGSNPTFKHFIFFAPVILSALYFSQPQLPMQWMLTQSRYVLLFYVYGSLAFAALQPSWATSSAAAYIPGLTFRLNGIAPHSNILATLALLALAIEVQFRKRRLWSYTNMVATALVVLLAQSKTIWATAALLFGLLVWSKVVTPHRRGGTTGTGTERLAGAVFVVLGGAAILTAAAPFVMDYVSRLDATSYRYLTTFTGRTEIWRITLQTWRENPFFGYGPDLWNVEYRLKYAPLSFLDTVGMAHNQVVHTLGESGIFGLIGLVVYLVLLISYAYRNRKASRGISIVLLLLVLLRSVSETPLRNYAIDSLFFVHFLLFAVLLLSERASPEPATNRPFGLLPDRRPAYLSQPERSNA